MSIMVVASIALLLAFWFTGTRRAEITDFSRIYFSRQRSVLTIPYFSSSQPPIEYGASPFTPRTFLVMRFRFRPGLAPNPHPNVFQTAPGNSGIRMELSDTTAAVAFSDTTGKLVVSTICEQCGPGKWHSVVIRAINREYVQVQFDKEEPYLSEGVDPQFQLSDIKIGVGYEADRRFTGEIADAHIVFGSRRSEKFGSNTYWLIRSVLFFGFVFFAIAAYKWRPTNFSFVPGSSRWNAEQRALPWRPDAEGLRGIAVLAVLVFHAVPSLLPGGFLGVDVFFVLSGFLVGGIVMTELASGTFSLYGFYAKRSRRLFPALFLVLCATLVAASYILPSSDLKELGRQTTASAVFGANFLAWAQSGYFAGEAAYKPLIHLWSLGVEEQFYLLFPCSLVFFWKKSDRAVGRFLLVVGALSFALCVWLTKQKPDAAFYLPFTRFWELLVGAGLAYYRGNEIRNSATTKSLDREVLSWIGLVALVGSLFVLNGKFEIPGWVTAIPVMGAFLLLATGPQTFLARRVLGHSVLRWLGGVSYAAYLWHWPVLVLARFRVGGELSSAMALGLTSASVLAAWLSTELVEKPFRSGGLSKVWKTAPLLFVSMIMLAVVALPASNAVASRVPEYLKGLEKYTPQMDGDPWRSEKKCFVNLNTDEPFGKECLGAPNEGNSLFVLWGDSHAAALWHGLNGQAKSREIRLAELTVSSCPPLIERAGEGNMQCPAMRARALNMIATLRPDVVVMAARWDFYDAQRIYALLRPTVVALQRIGVRRIVLIGPAPVWKPTLAKALALDMSQRHLREVPESTSFGLQRGMFPIDDRLKTAAEAAGMDYVSVLSVLCHDGQCRTWADPDRKTALMAFDDSHVTPEGSSVVGQLIADQVFPNFRTAGRQ